MSTHTLLGSPDVERVDTVEIERAMYEGARHFGIRSERAYSDPRSHVVFEDAKTFFYQRGERYDIIVSEPSNPWVSGVSSLFTTEFYRMAGRFLNEGGVLAQWLHAYETNTRIVHSVLKALAENFADFHVYSTNQTDLVIVASTRPDLQLPSDEPFRHEALRRELERVEIRSPADLRARFLADKAMLAPLLGQDPVPVNSDYFPFVDLHAAESLFTRDQMAGLYELRAIAVPILQYLRPALFAPGETVTTSRHWFPTELRADAEVIAAGGSPAGETPGGRVAARLATLHLLEVHAHSCKLEVPALVWEYALLDTTMATVGYLDAQRLEAIERRVIPECPGGLTGSRAEVAGLYSGYAHGDFSRIAASAEALLKRQSRYEPNYREFFVASLLFALAAADRGDALARAWDQWIPEVIPDRNRIPYALLVLYANAVPVD
jgi:hypothetical protein